MSMHYIFNQNEIDNITKRFGKEFYHKVLQDIRVYAANWNLTSFQFIPSYSAKLVFKCFSEKYGDVVLKIGDPSSKEIVTECNTLTRYNGKKYCAIFEADMNNGVMLEARVIPGTPLRAEKSLDKRLTVFCSLYKGLHIEPAKEDRFPTYLEWVERITAYMSKRKDCQELYEHMKKAKDICRSVSNLYSQKMLLHGDFHHDNMLLDKNVKYVLIDPKGVIGDPVLDVARFILNEYGEVKHTNEYKKINYIIKSLAASLLIPTDIIRKCLYVETVMGVCWHVEDGEDCSDLMQDVIFSETILERY